MESLLTIMTTALASGKTFHDVSRFNNIHSDMFLSELQYFVGRCVQLMPDLLDLRSDIPSLDIAKATSFTRLRSELLAFETSFKNVSTFMVDSKDAKMVKHHSDCARLLASMQNSFHDCEASVVECCRYFNEKETSFDKLIYELHHIVSAIEVARAKALGIEKRKTESRSGGVLLPSTK